MQTNIGIKLLHCLFFLIFVDNSWAQCNPKEYKRIFSEAVALQNKGKFIEAKNAYEAAKIYACDKGAAADAAVDALFEQIELLRLQSVLDRNRADSTADANRQQALTAYANDLAYKSTIALRDGDRTTAFRLAEFAHRYVDDDNLNVTNALVQALYYNENPAHLPLQWTLTLSRHTASVNSVAFSPDGKKLATGSSDMTAKIWDLKKGNDILTLSGHTANIISVAFSPDGKKLATGSWDRTEVDRFCRTVI